MQSVLKRIEKMLRLKNHQPIILNCFSRGGSNILWNIFLSHPDVCSPIRETLDIFRLDVRTPRIEGYKAAYLSLQWRLFDQWNMQTRRPISTKAQAYIDQTLFKCKLKTFQDDEMRYKTNEEIYTLPEIEIARLGIKNNNGLIFMSDLFVEMYPDVSFFALVRDPVALYESHKRYKTSVSHSPEHFTAFYKAIAQKMLVDADRWNFYHMVRFEDILRDPLISIQKIYHLAELDIDKIQQMRFKAKPHMHANGQHMTRFEAGKHYWFSLDDVSQILEPEVNRYQTSRLDQKEIEDIMTLTRDIRMQLGYGEYIS